MNQNAQKLYDVLSGKDPNFNLSFTPGEVGFSMRKVLHHLCSPCCIKGFAMALMQGAEDERYSIEWPIVSFSDNEEAKWLGIETRAAKRLFFPYSDTLQGTSVLEIIWKGTENPYTLSGVEGAKVAAEALKRACDNFPRVGGN